MMRSTILFLIIVLAFCHPGTSCADYASEEAEMSRAAALNAVQRDYEQLDVEAIPASPEAGSDASAFQPNDATRRPNNATLNPNDATRIPNDATRNPNNATRYPNDATRYPNDATSRPNKLTPAR